MILSKRPLRPTIFSGVSATFVVTGRSFYSVEAVYLSGYPYENTTLFNPFSGVPSLSAKYPQFTGIKLLSSQYTSNNENTVTFTMPPAQRAGYVDIIVQNQAGYGALTRYVIKELYTGSLPLSVLRPWSSGVRVLTGVEVPPPPDNLIYTFDLQSGLQTFAKDGIVTFAVGLSDQMYSLNNDFIVTILGDNIVTI